MPKQRTRKAEALANSIGREQAGHDDMTAPVRRESSRVMYIERKAGSLTGPARIGKVTFSKSGKTLHYDGKTFQSLKGAGFKSNYFDVESGEDYWISGPRRDGADRLYGEAQPVHIDDDAREEYWTDIRKQPDRKSDKKA